MNRHHTLSKPLNHRVAMGPTSTDPLQTPFGPPSTPFRPRRVGCFVRSAEEGDAEEGARLGAALLLLDRLLEVTSEGEGVDGDDDVDDDAKAEAEAGDIGDPSDPPTEF
eukprot:6786792-Pyramimonas_sp.AAC.2